MRFICAVTVSLEDSIREGDDACDDNCSHCFIRLECLSVRLSRVVQIIITTVKKYHISNNHHNQFIISFSRLMLIKTLSTTVIK